MTSKKKVITNKDFMVKLDTIHFELAMHEIYFNPASWVKGNDTKMHSTPNMFEIRKWLDSPYDKNSDFWINILNNDI